MHIILYETNYDDIDASILKGVADPNFKAI